MEGFVVNDEGNLILMDECGAYRYPPEGLFEIRWNTTWLQKVIDTQ
jgi:hypothetical protein